MAELIPSSALESHVGILGKTGSGKSNAAKTIAEHLMRSGARVCAIDPTGTWWGLRLSTDGLQRSDFEPVIFGGERADVQILPEHGAAIGEAIATSSGSAVIDLRSMGSKGRTKFFIAFAEKLLALNRGPLHLIIDEAHLFAPKGKVVSPQAGEMLAHANDLVSLGRGLGLRIIMITQRPAKLHNDSLSQIETMVAMRLIAPHDRRAIEDWIKESADPEKGKQVVASLSSLPVGDAWVWAPELDLLNRVHFPLASTYDSGSLRTGENTPTLAAIDTAAIAARLESIAADVLANDPKRLKAKVAELQRQLKSNEKGKTDAPTKEEIEAAETRGFERGKLEGVKEGMISASQLAAQYVAAALEHIQETPGRSFTSLQGQHLRFDSPDCVGYSKPARGPSVEIKLAARDDAAIQKIVREGAEKALDAFALSKQRPVNQLPERPGSSQLPSEFSRPELKVLRSLVLWRSLGNDMPTKIMVGGAAGYSHSSGGFNNLLGKLRSAGAIDYPQPGHVRIVVDGIEPMTRDEARDALLTVMNNPQRKLFDALIGGEMSKQELGEATGYSPTSGGFNNLLGRLRSLSIVEYPRPGQAALAAWVYEIL